MFGLRKEITQPLFNFNWLFFERVFQAVLSLFIGAWVARYLGPEQFGVLNYCIAFVALFSGFSGVGLTSLIVRNLVEHPSRSGETLGSAVFLNFICAIAIFVVASVSVFFIESGNTTLVIFVSLIAFSEVVKSLNVFDAWFQSRVQSKYVVLSNAVSSIIVSAIKIYLILSLAPLVAFVAMIPTQILLGVLVLYLSYQLLSADSIKCWRISATAVKDLLRDGWPLMLSATTVIVYMKIDQIMISHLIDDHALGQYSAAVKLSELWNFFPMAISGTVFPLLLKNRKEDKKKYLGSLQTLYDVFLWFSIFIALIVTQASSLIVSLVFGGEYSAAAPVLSIHIWSAVFVFLGVASSKYLIAENLTRISLYRTIGGAIINVALNLILIPRIGILGAAYATLCSYFFSAVVFNLLFKQSRIVFYMLLNTVNPLRAVIWLRRQ